MAQRLCVDLRSAWSRLEPTGQICFGAPPFERDVPDRAASGDHASSGS
jgi:hypothetical protein